MIVPIYAKVSIKLFHDSLALLFELGNSALIRLIYENKKPAKVEKTKSGD
ncbi:hypothetical protein [uncultured Gammaproteobacteria bacterium]|jgi:hypothetical protein|nr:hypothetical protein [uncultured Gammaproteobacteria bacterium]